MPNQLVSKVFSETKCRNDCYTDNISDAAHAVQYVMYVKYAMQNSLLYSQNMFNLD